MQVPPPSPPRKRGGDEDGSRTQSETYGNAQRYAGIAIEADNVLVVDNEKVIELANQHGLFLVAV